MIAASDKLKAHLTFLDKVLMVVLMYAVVATMLAELLEVP